MSVFVVVVVVIATVAGRALILATVFLLVVVIAPPPPPPLFLKMQCRWAHGHCQSEERPQRPMPPRLVELCCGVHALFRGGCCAAQAVPRREEYMLAVSEHTTSKVLRRESLCRSPVQFLAAAGRTAAKRWATRLMDRITGQEQIFWSLATADFYVDRRECHEVRSFDSNCKLGLSTCGFRVTKGRASTAESDQRSQLLRGL